MATATKTKATKQTPDEPDAIALAKQACRQDEALYAEFQEMSVRTDDDERLGNDDLRITDQAKKRFGWTERDVRMQRKFAREVYDAQRTLGSNEELTADERKAEAAEAKAKSVDERNRAEIERLESEIRQAETEASTARQNVEQRLAARRRLRSDGLPQFVRKLHDRRSRDVKRQYHFLQEARNRVASIDAQLAWDVNNVDDARALDLATSHRLRSLSNPMSHGVVNVDPVAYEAWAAELRREREDLLAEIAEHEPNRVEAQREVDELLDYYAPLREGETDEVPSVPHRSKGLAW